MPFGFNFLHRLLEDVHTPHYFNEIALVGAAADKPTGADAKDNMLYYETDTGLWKRYRGATGTWVIVGSNFTKLSELTIDADKDWQKKNITNFGAGAHNVNTKLNSIITKLSELAIDADKDWAGKNITNPGTVDGVDISAHAANTIAHTHVVAYKDPTATDYSDGLSIFYTSLNPGWPSTYGVVISHTWSSGDWIIQTWHRYNDPAGFYIRHYFNDATGWRAWRKVRTIAGISFNLGLATVGTKLAQALIPGTYTIEKVRLYADTAPSEADLIVDVNKNGTTIFTTQANRPKIVAGGHSGVSGTPNVTSFAEGDRLSVDIDTTPAGAGNDLLVTIIC